VATGAILDPYLALRFHTQRAHSVYRQG
jgi:hypothetical protein